jgi:uncharacterized protein YjbI with pentapeptide repeats/endonuclease YncB( thermonuclease family)
VNTHRTTDVETESETHTPLPAKAGVLGAGALVAVVGITLWLAWKSGAGWLGIAAYGFIVALAAFLAARQQTPREKIAAAGQGVVVAILLALVANSISHQQATRNARDSLRLTLSSGKSFTGIDLRGRHLEDAYIGGGKHLSHADLRGAHLQRAVLSHSTLRETDFHGSKTDLSNADLSYSDLSGSDLRSVKLNGADLTQTNLTGAQLAGAHLRGATLEGARLNGADLRGVDLRAALLMGAHLQRALLIDADLRGAKLTGDLRAAELDGAALSGVRIDSHTRWPKGFDLANAVAEVRAPPATKVKIPPDAAIDAVSAVADGDTIELRDLGHVRLSGLDAPSDESPEACYGHEATVALRQLLPVGTRVLYISGSKPQDAYHRHLAFLWLPSGAFINERLVAAGDATFNPLEKPKNGQPTNAERFYAKRMKRDVMRAAMAKRGLWGACSPTD